MFFSVWFSWHLRVRVCVGGAFEGIEPANVTEQEVDEAKVSAVVGLFCHIRSLLTHDRFNINKFSA